MQWKSTLFLFCAATLAGSQVSAQTFTKLYQFNGWDGANPVSGLIADGAGNLYGTTLSNGPDGSYNNGTVFKLSPSGTLTTLHTFTGGADGSQPRSSLVADAVGNLYGTTLQGGDAGAGVVFKITKSGSYVRLYSFCADRDLCLDGSYPAGLTADAAGNLYGVTTWRGPNAHGTIFKVTPDGVLTTLYSFSNRYPKEGALVPDKAGNLYGTMAGYPDGYGQLYKLTPSGTFTTLYTFGQWEDASLSLIDSAGNFYGTTYDFVFKLTPGGTLNKLYTFVNNLPAPFGPNPSLIADAAGNLYGTTLAGGTGGFGTIFKLTPTGTLTTLHSFRGAEGGDTPVAGLLADGVGNFYGTTALGGVYNETNGLGTIFKLALPATFWGTPGTPNCAGQSVSFLSKKYGGLAAAATALGYPSVEALQSAIAAYCGAN